MTPNPPRNAVTSQASLRLGSRFRLGGDRRAAWLGACGLTTLTLLGLWWGSQGATVVAQPPATANPPGQPTEAATALARAQAEIANLTARFNPPARPAHPSYAGARTNHAQSPAPADAANQPQPLASLVYNEEFLTVLITHYGDHVALRGWLVQPPALEEEAERLNQGFNEDDFAMPAWLRVRQFGLKLDPSLDPITRATLIQRQGLPPLIVGMVDSLIGSQLLNDADDLDQRFGDDFAAPEDDFAAPEVDVDGLTNRIRARAAATTRATADADNCLEGLAVATVDGLTKIEARYRDAQGQPRHFRAQGSAQAIEQTLIRECVPQNARQAILRALPAPGR